MSNKKCKNCEYALQVDHAGLITDVTMQQFHCVRYPPIPLVLPAQGGVSIQAAHPVMAGDAFCGEYTPKAPALEPVS